MKTIYLDNAATTKMRREVLEAMIPCMTDVYGNPSSAHGVGRDAKSVLDRARKQVAAVLRCEPREVYFTAGGSESDNWALRCCRALSEGKRHIITDAIEHHAVLHTCDWLKTQGIDVTVLPVDHEGFVDPAAVRGAIREDTALISVMAANNEIGTLQPVEEIGAIAKEASVLFHTDAVQAAGAIPLDVNAWNCDLLSLSGHKFHGPKGVGVLYIRKNVRIGNLIFGGAQERGLRAGTENVAGIAGLGEALTLASAEQQQNAERVAALRDRLLQGILAAIPDAVVNGSTQKRLPGNLNLSVPGVDGTLLLTRLDLAGIQVSGGSACTSGSPEPSHVLEAIGRSDELARNSLRFSLGSDNTEEEIDTVLGVLPGIVQDLRQG